MSLYRFDVVVVSVSFISLAPDTNWPGLNLVRFIRVFRVIKLFKVSLSLYM